MRSIGGSTLVLALCLAILVGAGAAPALAAAPPPLVLSPQARGLDLDPHLSILEDPGRGLTREEVLARTDSFRPNPGNSVRLGLTGSAYWLSFRMVPHPDPDADWLLELGRPLLERLELHWPRPGGGYGVIRLGSLVKETGGRVSARTPVILLPDRFDPERPFLLRIDSRLPLDLDMVVWDDQHFAASQAVENLGMGWVYGVLSAMILYNLVLFLSLRNVSYLFYVLSMGGILAFQLGGLGHVSLLPGLGEAWGLYLGVYLAPAWAIFWGLAFARHFLQTDQMAPRLGQVMLVLMILACLAPAAAALGWRIASLRLAAAALLAGGLVVILAGGLSLFQGFRPARFFLLAWLVFLACGGVLLFNLEGWLAPNPITAYAVLIGWAVMAVLLSFALADRISAMRREREELQRSQDRYRQLSLTDPLTGLYNKRHLMARLESEVAAAHQGGEVLSVLALDLDRFKEFNDAFGHLEGDKVLTTLARVLDQSLRRRDVACRFGGEEFVAILPGAGSEEALAVAERVRMGLAAHPMTPEGVEPVVVTASLGVAQLAPDEPAEALLHRADQALYAAKAAGRDCTVVARPPAPAAA